MASSKISALTAATAASTDDLLVIVDDPGGTPASKKITVDNFQGSLSKVGKVTVTQPATSATLTLTDGTTVTGPAASGTLATLAGSETLSNKTLTAPKFADGGFIADASGNEQLVFDSNASAVNYVEIANAATGNAVHIHARGDDANVGIHIGAKAGGYVNIEDGTDETKRLRFDVSGATTGKIATLTSAHTVDRTITLPDATDTLVGKATTDTLTNKTINLASNTLSGTTAEFNTALSDGSFATLAGSESLSNKTIAGAAISGALTGTGAYIPVSLLNSGTSASASTFWRGDGTWATPSGATWGTSLSGTTDSGIALTLSNSSDDGAAALKITAGNTQTNQPVLANLQIGTSQNVMGMLIQGTPAGVGGAAGTGRTMLCLWENVNSATDNVFIVGNGSSFTEQMTIGSDGHMVFTPTVTGLSTSVISVTLPTTWNNTTPALRITAGNTQAVSGVSLQQLRLGTSGNVMGLIISGTGSTTAGDVGTGANHLTLWGNTANNANTALSIGNGASYTENFIVSCTGDLLVQGTGNGFSSAMIAYVPTALGNTRSFIGSAGSNNFPNTYTGKVFNIDVPFDNSALSNRTNPVWSFTTSRNSTRTSGTTADNNDSMYVSRTSIQNGGGGTFTSAGSVLKLENIATQTAGTLTDSANVLSIVQDVDSTGIPISITQNAVVSTNYRKLIKETATGITIWMGNGTTANGTLSGTAGDILINGGSNKPEYCTGTTNWTALV